LEGMRFAFVLSKYAKCPEWVLLANTWDEAKSIIVPKAKETFDSIHKKCGVVIVNRNGGMSPTDLHELISVKYFDKFPDEPPKPLQWPGGIHWYIGDKRFNTYTEAEKFLKG
jgi:hypothetical protein